MLIIANGAYKSGSTWLFNIVRAISEFHPPPKKYLNDNINPSIDIEKLPQMLARLDIANGNYLTKNHITSVEHRDMLLENANVRVLNIDRDIRDVIVSTYYHLYLKNNYRSSFKTFYWSRGRYRADRIREYHKLWDVDSQQVIKTHFKTLKESFDDEIQRLSTFLGYSLDHEQILRVKEQTSIKNLRKKYGENDNNQKFFRKGVIGDWQNHMTPTMLRDLDRVYKDGLSSFDRSFVGRFFHKIILAHIFSGV